MIVIPLAPRVETDDEEFLQDIKECPAAAAAHQNFLQAAEMRELLEKARAELGHLDPISQAILEAIEDSVFFGIKSPSDKEIASACGARQNTVTVRRRKMKARIGAFLSRGLGYAAPKRPVTHTSGKGMKPSFPPKAPTKSKTPSTTPKDSR